MDLHGDLLSPWVHIDTYSTIPIKSVQTDYTIAEQQAACFLISLLKPLFLLFNLVRPETDLKLRLMK